MDYEIGIVGGGFGGLGIAIRLKKEGKHNFVIFERASEVGGTWRDNTYPGCGCDIPSHLYSYSFELNPNWSRDYSKQPEILEYILHCKRKYGLEQHIRYNSNIVNAVFEEGAGLWKVTNATGEIIRVKILISAIGPLNVPKIPDFKGLDRFEGAHFHSSEWDDTVDLKGKRVAVVGTGASAVQLVPEIAPEVAQLHLFQRTAPWILPKNDSKISAVSKTVFRTFPFIQRLRRSGVYWFYEFAGGALFTDNQIRKSTRKMAKKHLEETVKDPALRKKLTPNYEIGCKRRLPSDNYYPALIRKNVEVVTDSIQEILPNGIVDETGRTRPVDVILWATGFHVSNFDKRGLSIIGRNGLSLFDSWREKGPEGYYGTCVSGFPGLLFIMGPNTGLGHNSQLHMMESQFNYIIDYLKVLDKLPKYAALDVKASAQQQFNDEIHESLAGMVWSSGGCNSWYLHESGRNSMLWPGYTATFRRRTKKIIQKDFEILQ